MYVVSLISSTAGDGVSYVGTDRQFTPRSAGTGAALTPGSYIGTLLGFGGAFSGAGGAVNVSNNVTGAGVTGVFYSQSSVPTITFTVQ